MPKERKKRGNTFLRPAFTKKGRAEAQVELGRFQAEQSRGGSRVRSLTFTDKSNRKRQFDMGKAAAGNLVQGTIALNKAKGKKKTQRRAALPRPPRKIKHL